MQDGEFPERERFSPDHLFARSVRHCFRKESADLRELRQHLQFAHHPFGHTHLQKLGNSRGHVFDRMHLKREFHPAHACKGVDQDRNGASFGMFKEQRRSA